jgi:hypothetical protein
MIGIGMIVGVSVTRVAVTDATNIHAKDGESSGRPLTRELDVHPARSNRMNRARVREDDAGAATAVIRTLAEHTEQTTVMPESHGTFAEALFGWSRDEIVGDRA